MGHPLINRPQPIGIFPLPSGFLLLPPSEEGAALSALMAGDISHPLPPEWHFFQAAVSGRIDEARDFLSRTNTPLSQYNLFVLGGANATTYKTLQVTLPSEIRPLLDLAAFHFGLTEHLPSPESVDGELRAAILLASASRHLEANDGTRALSELESAVECTHTISPIFTAQLLAQIASLQAGTAGQDIVHAIGNYRSALQFAGTTPLAGLRAELWLNLGICYQEHADGRRDYLAQAIQAYQEAVHCGLSETHQPEMYALVHNNLGLAYLSMPMVEASDSLRKAVAIQSFREALKVYLPETHRLEWVSAKLNLANALQHLPSSHPEENLVQAVEIYEELLNARSRAEDPVGYARLLANQANALAHLGLFSQSLEKANEAYKLFHWHNETDAAESVLQLVSTVHESISNKQVPV